VAPPANASRAIPDQSKSWLYGVLRCYGDRAAAGRGLGPGDRRPAWPQPFRFERRVPPDGTRAVTASWDHTARLWDVATHLQGNIFQIACARLPDRDLTDIARDYGLTNLEPVCLSDPPLPDSLAQ
jgi:hypothetical protein